MLRELRIFAEKKALPTTFLSESFKNMTKEIFFLLAQVFFLEKRKSVV
jgi:hypothetical protein